VITLETSICETLGLNSGRTPKKLGILRDFLSPSRKILRYYLDYATLVSFQIFSNLLIISSLTLYSPDIGSVVKHPTNKNVFLEFFDTVL
jgi:hypothetical protein